MSSAFLLRPLSVGELLDAAFRLARRLYSTLVTLQLMAAVIPLAVGMYIAASGMSAENPAAALPITFVTSVVNLVFASLASGAASLVISEAYLGRVLRAPDAVRRALPRIGTIISTSLLTSLVAGVCLIPFLVIVGGSAAVARLAQGASGAVVALLGVGVGVASLALPAWVLTGFALQVICAVLEPALDGMGAMRRSWALTKGFRARIFLIFVALIVIFVVVFSVLAMLFALAVPSRDSAMAQVSAVVLQTLVSLLVLPVLYSVLTLLYYDLRVRKEGFDLEMLAAALPGTPPSP